MMNVSVNERDLSGTWRLHAAQMKTLVDFKYVGVNSAERQSVEKSWSEVWTKRRKVTGTMCDQGKVLRMAVNSGDVWVGSRSVR